MPLMTHWIGGKSLKTGSKISGVVILVSLMVELVFSIYSIVRLHSLKVTFPANAQMTFFPPGLLPLAYIKLSLTLIGIIISGLFTSWVSKGYVMIHFIRAWCAVLAVIRGIELIFGIYILAWIGGDDLGVIVVIAPEIVVFAAFWIALSLVLILSILGVVSYCEELILDFQRAAKDSAAKPLQGGVEKIVQARVIASSKPPTKSQSEAEKPKKPRRYLKKGESRELDYESGV
ncbi:uncharacterized protein LOC135502163 [Lineus longissimus]|uniref:uncharacterized protein LOC135502163 n=1 Tax=Lineus longissimus TaxID=88925 RepID=UPI002B4F75BB